MKVGGHILYRLADINAYEEPVDRQETHQGSRKGHSQDRRFGLIFLPFS